VAFLASITWPLCSYDLIQSRCYFGIHEYVGILFISVPLSFFCIEYVKGMGML
jgi:hypothetical protein